MRTDHVIHGLPGYIDYDRVWGNKRQVLVTDLWSVIWSNFLAVFLALAGTSLFNIVGRFTWARPAQVQLQDAAAQAISVNTNGHVDSSAADSSADGSLDDTAELTPPAMPASAAFPPSNVTQDTDPLVSTPDAASRPGHPTQQFHVSDPRPPDAMFIESISKLTEWFKNLFKRQEVGTNNSSLARKMLSWQFWLVTFDHARQTSDDLLRHLLMGFVGFFFYFGILLLGIWSAYPVISNSVALSQSPQCGFFGPASDPYSKNATKMGSSNQYWNEILRESRQYAKACYGSAKDRGKTEVSDSCSFFYQPTTPYAVQDNATCPFIFANEPLCLDGEYGAFHLQTGSHSNRFVDASVLGINSPLPYKFSRGLTCSPLQTENFVAYKKETNISGTFRYFYGERIGIYQCGDDAMSCTFELPISPDLRRSYDLFTTNTIASNRDTRDRLEWKPIFSFNETESARASIVLISNSGIWYAGESHDPIFPAHKAGGDGWYYNNKFHASVLACLSTTVICYGDSSPPQTCWDLESFASSDELYNNRDTAGGVMLLYSLLPSIDEELRFLAAESLDAQSLLFDYHSSHIPADQWKNEVRGLFETLLARTQIQTRNIARGVPGKNPPKLQNMLRPAHEGMCKQYKFQAVGWKNISFWRFFAEFVAGLMVCFIGIRRKDGRLWVESPFWRFVRSRAVQAVVAAARQVAGMLRR